MQSKRLSLKRRAIIASACSCALALYGWIRVDVPKAQAESVFLVTSLADSGAATLRQAMTDANANPGHDVIRFAIGAGGLHTLTLQSELPTLNDAVTIDGTTQPGYAGTPLIYLDGRSTLGASGLVFGGPPTATAGSVVRGLAIGGFENIGINLAGTGPYTVQASFVGVDSSGELALPNRLRGIYLAGSNSLIQDSVIVGDQGQTSLFVAGNDNVIENNRVGSNRFGNRALGNTAYGVLLGGVRNRLQRNVVLGNFSGIYLSEPASDTVIEGNTIVRNNGTGLVLNSSRNRINTNTIALNGLAGVSVQTGESNTIRANAIYSNTALGIDIDPAGQPNSADPLDADTGPNLSQNAPLIFAATSTTSISNGLALDVYLNSAPNQFFTIDVYGNTVCNGGTPSGRFGGDFGEGETYLGSFVLRTDVTGYVGTSRVLSTAVTAPSGAFLSATATDSNGNTSEFSACQTTTPPRLLALFAFALDNPPGTAGDLAPYYPEIERRLVEESTARPDRMAIVLRDLGGKADNTAIVLVRNGISMTLTGLPDASATLSATLAEYDMADSAALGGFMRWARNTHPAQRNYLEIQGHGTALAPATNYAALFAPLALRQRADAAVPLPRWVDAKDGFTDARSRSLFNVPALAQTLRVATQNGSALFDVIDVSHCFAATIEELHELAPYAAALVASPNYDYLLAEAPARIFAALDVDAPATQMAREVVQQLHDALPGWMHPGIFVAVDSSKLLRVKPAWDELSAALLLAFDADATTTRTRLRAAYQASAKYDTSQCEPDWALRAPDALVDMHAFALQLADQFDRGSFIRQMAITASTSISAAILGKQQREGQPWFAGSPTATLVSAWVFHGAGIGLFADFVGVANTSDASVALNWQAHWYTHTLSLDNPTPYSFVTPGDKHVSWADVVHRFWQGTEITTAACLSRLSLQLRQVRLPFVVR